MSDIVLHTGPLGGLGDLSLYTWLPERYAALGHRVLLHEDCLARNDEVFDLFWTMNPYIDGTSDRTPDIGYYNLRPGRKGGQGVFYSLTNRYPPGSIECMERAHELAGPYHLAPRIYYKPRPPIHKMDNAVLVDFHALSTSLAENALNEFLTKMTDRFHGCQMYALTFADHVTRSGKAPPWMPLIMVQSIYHYCDMLAACRAWIGSEAGGQALAAAVRGEHDVYELDARPEIVSLISPKTYNSGGYRFRGVDYRVTQFSSNNDSDYWDPSEMRQDAYIISTRHNVQEQCEKWRKAHPNWKPWSERDSSYTDAPFPVKT